MNLRPDPIIQIDLTRHLPDLHASLSVPAPAPAPAEPTALQTAAAAIALGAMIVIGLFLAFAH